MPYTVQPFTRAGCCKGITFERFIANLSISGGFAPLSVDTINDHATAIMRTAYRRKLHQQKSTLYSQIRAHSISLYDLSTLFSKLVDSSLNLFSEHLFSPPGISKYSNPTISSVQNSIRIHHAQPMYGSSSVKPNAPAGLPQFRKKYG